MGVICVLAQHAPGFTVHDIIIDAERVPSEREQEQLRRTATMLQAGSTSPMSPDLVHLT